jgi:hypothetical protein
MIEFPERYPSHKDRPTETLHALAPEHTLRRAAKDLIQQKPSHMFIPLLPLYARFGLYPGPNRLKEALITGIETAQKGLSWRSRNETGDIAIGYYNSVPYFYTNLFHEEGHFTLNQFGSDLNAYRESAEPEEIFCWDFSKGLTSLLNLPYSEGSADLSLAISRIRQQLSRDKNNQRLLDELERLTQKEIALNGFSDTAQSAFIWTPTGIPQLVH